MQMNTDDKNPIVIIGSIGAPHGIKGWSKVNSFTRPKENIFYYSPWLIKLKEQWQEIEFTEHQPSHHRLRIKIAACDDRNQASLYTKAKIGVYRKQLPQLDLEEYYWTDLENLTVINQQGVILGQVSYLFETGANDVIVVKGEKEHFIPYILDLYVLNIDLENSKIEVDWDPEF